MKSRRAGWIGGTAFLIVLIFAGTWFLVASPRFDAAEETMQQVEQTRSSNELLELQLIALRADFARMDEYRAELLAFQAQIPTEALLDEVVATIHELAVAQDVDIVEIAPGIPTVVTVAAPPADLVPVPPATGEGGDGSVEETEQPANGTEQPADDTVQPGEPELPAVPQVDGLIAVPIMVKILGPYANAMGFLETYQTGYERLLLVTEWTGVRQKQEEAGQGKRATADGDLELEIHGYVYVLINPIVESVMGGEEPELPAAPMPGSDRNPFLPLGATGGGATGGDD